MSELQQNELQIAQKNLSSQPNTELTNVSTSSVTGSNVFFSKESFELAYRVSRALAESDLIPKDFRGKPSNCLIAVELAARLKMSPFMVLQNLDVINGKPSLSSKFIIGLINNCGQFSTRLRWEFKGEGMSRECIAYAIDKQNAQRIESPIISMQMADKEGWLGKSGSKWKTMPDLMMMYRSGSFFGRLYTPDLLMGMQSTEELEDIKDITPSNPPIHTKGIAGAKELLTKNLEPKAEDISTDQNTESNEVIDEQTGEILTKEQATEKSAKEFFGE